MPDYTGWRIGKPKCFESFNHFLDDLGRYFQ